MTAASLSHDFSLSGSRLTVGLQSRSISNPPFGPTRVITGESAHTVSREIQSNQTGIIN